MASRFRCALEKARGEIDAAGGEDEGQDSGVVVEMNTIRVQRARVLSEASTPFRTLAGDAPHTVTGSARGRLDRTFLQEHDFEYDLLVVGGGSGGLACSKEAAALGAKVLVHALSIPHFQPPSSPLLPTARPLSFPLSLMRSLFSHKALFCQL